jgi:hypothetical protein
LDSSPSVLHQSFLSGQHTINQASHGCISFELPPFQASANFLFQVSNLGFSRYIRQNHHLYFSFTRISVHHPDTTAFFFPNSLAQMNASLILAVLAVFVAFASANVAIYERYGAESMQFFRERYSEAEELQASSGSSFIVDYSTYASVSVMSCLHNSGFVSAIPRGYCSVGSVDSNMVSNVNNARAAGFNTYVLSLDFFANSLFS